MDYRLGKRIDNGGSEPGVPTSSNNSAALPSYVSDYIFSIENQTLSFGGKLYNASHLYMYNLMSIFYFIDVRFSFNCK